MKKNLIVADLVAEGWTNNEGRTEFGNKNLIIDAVDQKKTRFFYSSSPEKIVAFILF